MCVYICNTNTNTQTHKHKHTNTQTHKHTHTQVWSQPDISGTLPAGAIARCHSAALVCSKILCFGGGPSFRLTNGLVALDTRTMQVLSYYSTCYCTDYPTYHCSALMYYFMHSTCGYAHHALAKQKVK